MTHDSSLKNVLYEPLKRVRSALSSSFPVREFTDGIRVVTHHIYPGHSFVQVLIQGGPDTFVVSDEGNAVRMLTATGAEIENPDSMVAPLLTPNGLHIRDGVISSSPVDAGSLGVAIAFVAGASREVAEYLFAHCPQEKPDLSFGSPQ